jgi:hypothetical protein
LCTQITCKIICKELRELTENYYLRWRIIIYKDLFICLYLSYILSIFWSVVLPSILKNLSALDWEIIPFRISFADRLFKSIKISVPILLCRRRLVICIPLDPFRSLKSFLLMSVIFWPRNHKIFIGDIRLHLHNLEFLQFHCNKDDWPKESKGTCSCFDEIRIISFRYSLPFPIVIDELYLINVIAKSLGLYAGSVAAGT